MTTKQEQGAPVSGQHSEAELSDDPAELRAQIDETRAELGETVEALAAKADVKAQLKNKVASGKDQLKEKQEEAAAKLAQVRHKVGATTPDQARVAVGTVPERIKARPLPAVLVGGLLVGWLVWKRRR